MSVRSEKSFLCELAFWDAAVLFAVFVFAFIWMRGCRGDGIAIPVFAQAGQPAAQYQIEAGMALPDPELTPGAVNAAVVADRSGAAHKFNGLEVNICAKDFRATAIRKTIRNFAKLKKQACQEYGIDKCDASVEGDHLVSIEIGGCPDCLKNLWPQPMDEARVKDHQVEDVLPKLVCAGKISLGDAQACIAKDWIACGERIKKLE
jgi:hypothetical protein